MKNLKILLLASVLFLQIPAFAREYEPVRLSRTQWGASAANSRELSYDQQQKSRFIIGHQGSTSTSYGTRADAETARSIQNYHMGPQNRWADIGYHMMIGRNGTALDGRDINAEPVCNRDYNSGSICMVFLGCFDRSCGANEVTNSMIFSMGKIIGEMAYQLGFSYLGRHNVLGISELGSRYPNSPGNLIMGRNATGHIQIDVIARLANIKLAKLRGIDHDDL